LYFVSFGEVSGWPDFEGMQFWQGWKWLIRLTGNLLALQPRQPLPGILDFGKTGASARVELFGA